MEGKIKGAIEGGIQQELKKVEATKNKLLGVTGTCDELGKKINGYVEKFDKMKVEMDENQKKFSNYQSDIETKKTTIQALEAEI